MAIDIVKPGERITPGEVGICIYGPNGVGKTTLLGTMPGYGLIIGNRTLEGGDDVLADKADRIDVVYIEEFEDIDEIYWAVAKKDKDKLPHVNEYKWVAFDTISAIQELAKRKVIGERDIPKAEHKVSPQDWGYTGQLTIEVIFRFNKLPLSKIWVAQERKFGGADDDAGPVYVGPAVLPSVVGMLKQPLTIVGRLTVDEETEQRRLRVKPHHLYMAKSRVRPGKSLPDVIRDPNLEVILRYMYGNGKRPRQAKDDTGILLD